MKSIEIKDILMEVYHVTTKSYAEKIQEKGFKVGKEGRFGGGVYFFNNEQEAKRYNPNGEVLKAIVLNLDIAFLYYHELPEMFKGVDISWEEEEGVPELKEWAKTNGYNGCLVAYDDGTSELVVYEPTLIKLYPENYEHYKNVAELIANGNISGNFLNVDEGNKQLRALLVKTNPNQFRNLRKPNSFICKLAVKGSWSNLRFINNQSKELCYLALEQSPKALQFVKKQTLEMCERAVEKDPYVLMFVKEQTEEMCIKAIRKDASLISFVDDQTPAICLEAIKLNPMTISTIREQTPELCLEAVKRNWQTLTFCDIQTPEICMAALEQDSSAFKYFKI